MKPILLTLTLALLVTGCSETTPPPFPCNTPEELKRSLELVYRLQDTNLFWKLHWWTNVSAKSEEVFKATSLGSFKSSPTDKVKYSSFAIRNAPPGINTPRPLKNGGQMQYSIPVTGIITFRSKGGVSVSPGEKPVEFSADGASMFGKGPDGNYWLAVEMRVP